MNEEIPDEDKFLASQMRQHEHEYVDFYVGWCYVDEKHTKLLVYVFCKKCLDKKKIYLDLSEAYDEDNE